MPKALRLLILGARGQVGQHLRQLAAADERWQVTAVDRTVLDLQDLSQVQALLEHLQPDVIVNAAAYTAVDKAETDLDNAMHINAELPECLARWAGQQQHTWLIHYSTDYVFSGQKTEPYVEDDEPHPLSAYGRSKLAGEQHIRQLCPRHLIFRTSWVYHEYGHNFFQTMLRLAETRPELKVVHDQIGAPTDAFYVAEQTMAALNPLLQGQNFKAGLYHLTNMGATSWCDFARAIFARMATLHPERAYPQVLAIPSSDYPLPAPRPHNSRLNNQRRLTQLNGQTAQDWETALELVCQRHMNLQKT